MPACFVTTLPKASFIISQYGYLFLWYSSESIPFSFAKQETVLSSLF